MRKLKHLLGTSMTARVSQLFDTIYLLGVQIFKLLISQYRSFYGDKTLRFHVYDSTELGV